MNDDELIVDSFAGGGGASLGIAWALGRAPDIAINHDPSAIEMHAANHPSTEHVIVDIGMRMLTPRELARAQGFPDTYLLTGTKTSQVARIGNSVCPHVAAAIVKANCVEGVIA